ncbi:MAG: phytanoyl-CoA dioxygenase family protein [Candidatus Methylacidiphilales bacterium]|nr:phytanoyl-CoA dioxygenase family protein [Candidatus Methylacidiphilales bacterium]
MATMLAPTLDCPELSDIPNTSSPASAPATFTSWKDGRPPAGWHRGPVDAAAKKFYDDNGFIVLDRALVIAEVDALNADATRICANRDGSLEGVKSAPEDMPDDELLRAILCIHFPHKLSPLMHDTLAHPAIAQSLSTLIGPDVKCMQSMLFIKASGKPGQAWHQDEDYIPTRDRSLTGAWIALDDATLENGCLWVIPGSHRPGILWKQEWHGDRRFDCAYESRGFPYTDADAVPVEVKKGSIVIFNGYTLHRSLPNQAKSGFRRALVNHYMSAQSFLPWQAEPGVGIAQWDYRDIVMITGADPFAYKGYTNISKASVRASGEGGCVDWNTKAKRPYNDEVSAAGIAAAKSGDSHE